MPLRRHHAVNERLQTSRSYSDAAVLRRHYAILIHSPLSHTRLQRKRKTSRRRPANRPATGPRRECCLPSISKSPGARHANLRPGEIDHLPFEIRASTHGSADRGPRMQVSAISSTPSVCGLRAMKAYRLEPRRRAQRMRPAEPQPHAAQFDHPAVGRVSSAVRSTRPSSRVLGAAARASSLRHRGGSPHGAATNRRESAHRFVRRIGVISFAAMHAPE